MAIRVPAFGAVHLEKLCAIYLRERVPQVAVHGTQAILNMLLAAQDESSPIRQAASAELMRICQQVVGDAMGVMEILHQSLAEHKESFKADLRHSAEEFVAKAETLRADFLARAPFGANYDVDTANRLVAEFTAALDELRTREVELREGLAMFDIDWPPSKDIAATARELDWLTKIWELTTKWNRSWKTWKSMKFASLVVKTMEDETAKYYKRLLKLGRDIKKWQVWAALKERVAQVKDTMPLITDLKNPAIRRRHWLILMDEVGAVFDPASDDFTLERIIALGLDQYRDIIAQLSLSATNELAIENELKAIETAWAATTLTLEPHKADHYRVVKTDEVFALLEEHMISLSHTKSSRYYAAFQPQVEHWEKTLTHVLETVELMLQVQRHWLYLENIFMGPGGEIRRQLPTASQMFQSVDSNWRIVMERLSKNPNAKDGTHMDGLSDLLFRMNKDLETIQKSLDQYLETKRVQFPRFYFLSDDELLEILGSTSASSGDAPGGPGTKKPVEPIQKHIKKCFEGIQTLDFMVKDARKIAYGMNSPDGENVAFSKPVYAEGPVEEWLRHIEDMMQLIPVSRVSGGTSVPARRLGSPAARDRERTTGFPSA